MKKIRILSTKNHIFPVGIISLLFLPLITLAAAPKNFSELILLAVNILTAVLPVIVLLAFIYFIWGLAQYLRSEEGKASESKTIMVHGLIAFFVMSGVWGFVWILVRTFVEPGGANNPDTAYEIINTDWSKSIPKIKVPTNTNNPKPETISEEDWLKQWAEDTKDLEAPF